MTRGLLFLLCTLVEVPAAGFLGWLLGRRLGAARTGLALRCATAAMIATGVTHPGLWLWSGWILDLAGSWWGGAAITQVLVILAETPVYAAALRGHWRLSLAVSTGANLAAFAAALLLAPLLP